MKFIIATVQLTTHRAASEVLDLDWEIKTAVGLLQLRPDMRGSTVPAFAQRVRKIADVSKWSLI